ncbi:MAG: YvcK family protein [Chloroflexi bacterium]|nr:YvcK family protein [Chloroflexota bacterium]MBV9897435.1 YvcK family protein [Chloroflexota bacterium]
MQLNLVSTATLPGVPAPTNTVSARMQPQPLKIGLDATKVVVVGGGTGSHTVLTGLRHRPLDVTAVVSVMDSGGSSGRLRDEYGVLPPGDARQCLVALAGNDDEAASLLRALFTYRFHGGRSLDGHNLGNLFISALTDITGSVEAAYAWAGRLLGARGRVIPVTTSNVHLCAKLTDGHVLHGEASIDVRTEHPDAEIDYVYLDHPAYPTHSAIEALRGADLVVIGPGDLYTSLIPNLLVDGICEAIAAARQRVYIVNLMTKPGESDGFTASTFVDRLLDYLAPAQLDAVLVNTSIPDDKVLQRYAREGASLVEVDAEAIRRRGIEVIAQPLVSARHLVRHDPTAAAGALLDWLAAQKTEPFTSSSRI